LFVKIIIYKEDLVHHQGGDWLFGRCPARGVGIGSQATNNREMVDKVYRELGIPSAEGPLVPKF